MQNTQRVIQLAHERAIFRFSTLAQRTIHDANQSLEKSLTTQGGSSDYRTRQTAQLFLVRHGESFKTQLETFFSDYLTRAMRTMYQDIRREPVAFSADSLSLIDDETITRNMDVDRLVHRMRDTDSENLGRLNIMIAQLHEDHDVRERENPFRPYLLARSLYEVLWAMEPEEQVADVLFEYLSTAMVKQVPDYFAGVREVFETSGVHARLLARPSSLSRAERLELARQSATQQFANALGGGGGGGGGGGNGISGSGNNQEQGSNPINQGVLTSLQRVLESMPEHQRNANPGESPPDRESQMAAFQQLVSTMFGQNRQPPLASTGDETGDLGFPMLTEPALNRRREDQAQQPQQPQQQRIQISAEMLAKLNQFQQIAARGQIANSNISAIENQLSALREQLGAEKSTTLERVTIDVVASLFEFILVDDHIPASIRAQIGRLQIPFLKAAMLTPELLRREDHPARQLLNRMGSISVGVDPSDPMGGKLADEIARIVVKILTEFSEDITIFSTCLEELEQFIGEQLRNADSETASTIEEIEEAEENSILLINTMIALRKVMAPLTLDKRVVDFILQYWARVLVHSHSRDEMDSEAILTASAPSLMSQQFDVLADLVWSTLPKGASQRSILLRMLPELVNRLKSALQMIELPKEEAEKAMDELFAVHAQVLLGTPAQQRVSSMTLDDLRQQFSQLKPNQHASVAEATDEVSPQSAETAEGHSGDPATPDSEASNRPPETDTEWLTQMRVGTSVERWSGKEYSAGRVVWVSVRRTLFMLKMQQDPKPVVYASDSLIKALREGSVRLVEYAPVFDRAVESLLIGAESIQPHIE